MTFQDVIAALERYWARRGCVIEQPYDAEVGAGTFHPTTFLRALGPEPWRVAYVQPSRRPVDGRYGDNPNRVGKYYQYQVMLKPAPEDAQGLYLASLRELGIDLRHHDIRFLEDDWESPTLGASGLGWQVYLDGQEITQFTYFQQMGGLDVRPVSAEITYGPERITMFLQRKASMFEIKWTQGITYGEIRHEEEVQLSRFGFDVADVEMLSRWFADSEAEAGRLLGAGLVLPAYDYVLKCSHLFNLLEARGVAGVAERTNLMTRTRALARQCAERYIAWREELGFPLLRASLEPRRRRTHTRSASTLRRSATSGVRRRRHPRA